MPNHPQQRYVSAFFILESVKMNHRAVTGEENIQEATGKGTNVQACKEITLQPVYAAKSTVL